MLAMIIIATTIAMIISKRISKPIEQLNQSAKVLAGGDYEVEFKGKGFLEIKELSDTLNITAIELSKVENIRRELIANISHDLRTPLALIYSYAEMMYDFPDEVTSEQSQIILDETKRLTSIVNDVLDISCLETGATKLNKEKYNLTESLRKAVNRMNELVKKDGYQIQFDYNEQVYVTADEVKISQVFYNLLLNAISYSGDDHLVVIKQKCKDKIVRIQVIDHGEGIKESDFPYIWERYYKVDKAHVRPRIGTGLGLSLVKRIMEMHDGEYGVESQLDEGSIFWFQLEITQL